MEALRLLCAFLSLLLVPVDVADAQPVKTFPKATEDSQRMDRLGAVLKRHVAKLRSTARAELVFLVDSSASVGAGNFLNELRFVRKLLADFTVSLDATRVALVTFSSKKRVLREVDHITRPTDTNHKCLLLNTQLAHVKYAGGGTFTLGAVLEAQVSACSVVFFVTTGLVRQN